MHWRLSYHADRAAAKIADRHYSRKTIGSHQFTPPGRKLVLATDHALWVTSWPFGEYVKHAWPGAMMCSIFRNESDVLSSTLIREALAATRWRYPELPPQGMITFIDRKKTETEPGVLLPHGWIPSGRPHERRAARAAPAARGVSSRDRAAHDAAEPLLSLCYHAGRWPIVACGRDAGRLRFIGVSWLLVGGRPRPNIYP